MLEGWADSPLRFKCEGAIGSTEEAAGAMTQCLSHACEDIKGCLEEAVVALCPVCAG